MNCALTVLVLVYLCLQPVPITRILTAMCVLFVTSSFSIPHANRGTLVTSQRWVSPCSGSVLVDNASDDVAMVTAEEAMYQLSGRGSRDNELVDWSNTLIGLSNKANKLRKNVRDLKRLFVRINLLNFEFLSVK